MSKEKLATPKDEGDDDIFMVSSSTLGYPFLSLDMPHSPEDVLEVIAPMLSQKDISHIRISLPHNFTPDYKAAIPATRLWPFMSAPASLQELFKDEHPENFKWLILIPTEMLEKDEEITWVNNLAENAEALANKQVKYLSDESVALAI